MNALAASAAGPSCRTTESSTLHVRAVSGRMRMPTHMPAAKKRRPSSSGSSSSFSFCSCFVCPASAAQRSVVRTARLSRVTFCDSPAAMVPAPIGTGTNSACSWPARRRQRPYSAWPVCALASDVSWTVATMPPVTLSPLAKSMVCPWKLCPLDVAPSTSMPTALSKTASPPLTTAARAFWSIETTSFMSHSTLPSPAMRCTAVVDGKRQRSSLSFVDRFFSRYEGISTKKSSLARKRTSSCTIFAATPRRTNPMQTSRTRPLNSPDERS